MYDRANIRRPGFKDGQHDVGRILNAMLYYQQVHLIIDTPLFLSLWDQLGPDGTKALLSHPSISSSLAPESPGILKNDGAVQTLRPIFMRAMGNQKKRIGDSDLIGSLRAWLINQTKWDPPSHRTVKDVLACTKVTQFSELIPDQRLITLGVKELVEKPRMLREFIRVWVSEKGGAINEELLDIMVGQAIICGDDLIISAAPELGQIVKLDEGPAQWSNFLGDIHNYVVELIIAGSNQGHMISASDVTQVAMRHLADALFAAVKHDDAISRFENVVFDDSRPFGRAFNEGRLSLEDALRTVDETAKFREWLAKRPNDADLLKEYHAAVTAVPRLKRMPASILRFAFFTGVGSLVPSGAGAVLSAIDQFLVDKLFGGWTPGTFAENVNLAIAPLARR